MDTVWKRIQDREVSLSMLFNADGDILWFRGREIRGDNIHDQNSSGFPKSLILKAIAEKREIFNEDIVLKFLPGNTSESGRRLIIKSMTVIPLANGYFLYLDSKKKEQFDAWETGFFNALHLILPDTFQAKKNGRKKIASIQAHFLRERVKEFVQSRTDDELSLLTVDDIAKNFKKTRRSLEYQVNKKGVFNLSKYLDEARLAKVKGMLQSGSKLPLREIGNRMGFLDYIYFKKVLKKYLAKGSI